MEASSETQESKLVKKFVLAVREQGILDENFDNQTNLHEHHNSMTDFCDDAKPKLDRVDKILENSEDDVDFTSVVTIMEEIKTNAASIGGKRVADACGELQQFCRDSDIESSKKAYKKVTYEYYILRDCFHHILMISSGLRNFDTVTNQTIPSKI